MSILSLILELGPNTRRCTGWARTAVRAHATPAMFRILLLVLWRVQNILVADSIESSMVTTSWDMPHLVKVPVEHTRMKWREGLNYHALQWRTTSEFRAALEQRKENPDVYMQSTTYMNTRAISIYSLSRDDDKQLILVYQGLFALENISLQILQSGATRECLAGIFMTKQRFSWDHPTSDASVRILWKKSFIGKFKYVPSIKQSSDRFRFIRR